MRAQLLRGDGFCHSQPLDNAVSRLAQLSLPPGFGRVSFFGLIFWNVLCAVIPHIREHQETNTAAYSFGGCFAGARKLNLDFID